MEDDRNLNISLEDGPIQATPEQLSKWRVWVLAARPKTLWAGIAPVIIGAAMAFDTGTIYLPAFFAALLGAILIQIGANFANDLFDYLKATDSQDRLGPLRVTQAGLVSLAEMKRATLVIFALASVVGAYLVYRGGMPVVIIGVTSILFAVLYTGGPLPLGHLGLGDLFVWVYFGPVAVVGTDYVITLHTSWPAFAAGVSAGFLSTAILTVNNLRDIDTDRRSGKKTLAVRFGRRFARYEYLIMVLAAFLIPILLFALVPGHPFVLISLVTLYPAVGLIRNVFHQTGRALNDVLAKTGQLLALFALLFAVGWLL